VRRLVEAIERQARERTEAGLPPDGLPDLSAEGERDGFHQAQLIRELAARHHHELDRRRARGRTGAADAREHRRGDGELYPVGACFFRELTLRQVLLDAAKSEFGLFAAGTSSRAEGPNIAEPAATMACPVPEADQEPTGGSVHTASTR
jgi:hypothetical protein